MQHHINELSSIVIGKAILLHTRFGPGVYESVYEVLLEHELKKLNIPVRRQVKVPLEYDGLVFEEAFRADLIVDNRLLIELKSVEEIKPIFGKQVRTYLKLTNLSLGIILNFGQARLKDGIERVPNDLRTEDCLENFCQTIG